MPQKTSRGAIEGFRGEDGQEARRGEPHRVPFFLKLLACCFAPETMLIVTGYGAAARVPGATGGCAAGRSIGGSIVYTTP
jgi:hypothetical protein